MGNVLQPKPYIYIYIYIYIYMIIYVCVCGMKKTNMKYDTLFQTKNMFSGWWPQTPGNYILVLGDYHLQSG